MNYRHAFHAGNAADVLKHAVLCLLLERLCVKPTPFCVLDTHAGIGRYDLQGSEATRTGEANAGIQRVLSATIPIPHLQSYLNAVQVGNSADNSMRWYPGSPRLARTFMRPGDRLILAELHPDDVVTLRQEFQGDAQTSVQHMDGWRALKAYLPPKERRGLVLIDPPFEAPDDQDRLVAGLALAHRRWATGHYALWYPVKERAAVWRLHAALEATGIPRILAVELTWAEASRPKGDPGDRLNGCGMILVNPPWKLDQDLSEMLPALHQALGAKAGGTDVTWIAPEPAAGN